MLSAGFEPTVPASERPQTHALDLTATGIGIFGYGQFKPWSYMSGCNEASTLLERSFPFSDWWIFRFNTGWNVANSYQPFNETCRYIMMLVSGVFNWQDVRCWCPLALNSAIILWCSSSSFCHHVFSVWQRMTGFVFSHRPDIWSFVCF